MIEELLLDALKGLIAWLATQAVRIFGKNPGGSVDPSNNPVSQQHHQWVADMLNDFFTALEAKSPEWIRPDEEAIKPLIQQAFDDLLNKAGA